MKTKLLALALLLAACGPTGLIKPNDNANMGTNQTYLGGGVYRTVDLEYGYICYSESDGGIECMKIAETEQS